MRRNPILLVLLAILVAQPLLMANLGGIPGEVTTEINGVFTPALGTRLAPGDHTNHVPISIVGNDDFVSQGWPGSGSSGDPYIISGLNITYDNGMILISIINTTAYFVIRDCYIGQGSSATGIDLFNASRGVIEHCTVSSPSDGITLYNSNSTTISHTEVNSVAHSLIVEYSWNCLVTNSEFNSEIARSAYWYQSPNPTLNYNYWSADYADDSVVVMQNCNNTVISHSTMTIGYEGLYILDSYDVQITNLTIFDITNGNIFDTCGDVSITDSHWESPETVLTLLGCNDSSVINSEFLCDDSGDPALSIYNSHRFTFTGNYLADAEANGLVVNNCEESVVNSNTFIECEDTGILIDDCPDSEIIGNTVHDSGGDGIAIYDSPRCTINTNDVYYAETCILGDNVDNSTFIGNTIDYALGALYIADTDYANISDNLISDAEYGVYIETCNWNRIHDNTISEVAYGIFIEGSGANNSVYNNDIMSASDTGIDFSSQDDIHVHHNTITDANSGIDESSTCDNTRIEENTLDSMFYGIWASGDYCSITGNVLTNMYEMGIGIYQGDNIVISGNTISGAPPAGVLTYSNINASFIDNTFTGCGILIDTTSGMEHYNHSISGNSVNGLPIYYGVTETGGSLSLASYGQIILLNCTDFEILGTTVGQVSAIVQVFYCDDITISDIISPANVRTVTGYETDYITMTDITTIGRYFDMEFSSYAFYLRYCDNFTIENLDYSGGRYGIYAYYSDDGSVVSSTFDNARRGFYGYYSDDLIINDCEITNMDYEGINLNYCDYAQITECDIAHTANEGIELYYSDYVNITHCEIYNATSAIYNRYSAYTNISHNSLHHSQWGVRVGYEASDNGLIHDNVITDHSSYGIRILTGDNWVVSNNTIHWIGEYAIYMADGSSGNEVYYNIIGPSGTANGYNNGAHLWDDGVDTGNWWSDYDGVSPTYAITGGGLDNYPMQFLPTTPLINDPLDLYYAEGDTGNELTWLVFDDYLAHYSVSIDGAVWAATACPDLTLSEIIIEVDGLAYGDHPVIITVWDIEDNTVTHSLTIHVFDDTNPIISSEPNMEVFVGGSGQEITWEVSDLHPDTYTVTIDDVVSASGTWTSGDLSADVDGLTVGVHTVIMTIYDADGNSAIDGVEILVISDSTNPVIDSPADLSIIYGSTGNRIIWTPVDTYPSGYEVSANSSVLIADDWGGSRIILDIDGLEVGEYTFTLTVWDGSGNEVSDGVDVVVLPYEGWTPEPTPDDYTMVLIAVGAVGGAIVIIVVVYFLKVKKS